MLLLEQLRGSIDKSITRKLIERVEAVNCFAGGLGHRRGAGYICMMWVAAKAGLSSDRNDTVHRAGCPDRPAVIPRRRIMFGFEMRIPVKYFLCLTKVVI